LAPPTPFKLGELRPLLFTRPLFFRLSQFESLVPLGRDLVALPPVTAYTFWSEIGQEGAWLANNVGTHVPRIGAGHQRLVYDPGEVSPSGPLFI